MKKIAESLAVPDPVVRCSAQVLKMTGYGVRFIRSCTRKATNKRYGRDYCKQHVKRAKKPILYGTT